MKIQISVDAQHHTITNKNDEIVISFQSTGVKQEFDATQAMRALGALFVTFNQVEAAVNNLTNSGESK